MTDENNMSNLKVSELDLVKTNVSSLFLNHSKDT